MTLSNIQNDTLSERFNQNIYSFVPSLFFFPFTQKTNQNFGFYFIFNFQFTITKFHFKGEIKQMRVSDNLISKNNKKR